tara:strand:- start:52 stop:273 length:222 start_codon:yes stop_codon:yes gene_type:complete
MDIANNEEEAVSQGVYSFSVSGPLKLQWRPSTEFVTLKDGAFVGVDDGVIELPSTTLKVIDAGANIITLLKVR